MVPARSTEARERAAKVLEQAGPGRSAGGLASAGGSVNAGGAAGSTFNDGGAGHSNGAGGIAPTPGGAMRRIRRDGSGRFGNGWCRRLLIVPALFQIRTLRAQRRTRSKISRAPPRAPGNSESVAPISAFRCGSPTGRSPTFSVIPSIKDSASQYGWRSPVLLRSEPGLAAAGISFNGAAGGSYAKQLLAYAHDNQTTWIPSDALTIGNRMYLHYVVNQGLGNVQWTHDRRTP